MPILKYSSFSLLLLVTILLYRALTLESLQPPREALITRAGGISLPAHLPLDADVLASRLAIAVSCVTVSSEEANETDETQFDKLRAHLREWYPLVHQRLEVERVPPDSPQHALLYTWRAASPRARPVLLLSHLDVVPAVARDWSVPPFEGRVSHGYVWGRGTMDDKAGVLAILHSLEYLLSQNFAPQRDVYVVFGADEEVGGTRTALHAARLLQLRGVRAELLLDEGQPIVSGIIQGVARPVALVATAEKGSLTVKVTARAPPGHSSMPPRTTAITELARALVRIEESKRPLVLSGTTTAEMFKYLAPEMSFAYRLVCANLWLFDPLLKLLLSRERSTRAAVQTTTAVTMVAGGVRPNVLPWEATAIVNHRLHPTDSVAAALDVDRTAAGDGVEVQLVDGLEPAPVSSTSAPSFRLLQRVIADVFPDAVSAPVRWGE